MDKLKKTRIAAIVLAALMILAAAGWISAEARVFGLNQRVENAINNASMSACSDLGGYRDLGEDFFWERAAGYINEFCRIVTTARPDGVTDQYVVQVTKLAAVAFYMTSAPEETKMFWYEILEVMEALSKDYTDMNALRKAEQVYNDIYNVVAVSSEQ